MKKNDILKILDIISYIMIIVATFLVVIFEFVGSHIIMKFALVIYFIGLISLTALLIYKTYLEFSKKFHDNENAADLTEIEAAIQTKGLVENSKQVTAVYKKHVRRMLIAKLVFSVVALIFTLVVLILYWIKF